MSDLLLFKLGHAHAMKVAESQLPVSIDHSLQHRHLIHLNTILIHLVTQPVTAIATTRILRIFKLLSALTSHCNYYFNTALGNKLLSSIVTINSAKYDITPNARWIKSHSAYTNNKFNRKSVTAHHNINNLNQIILNNHNNTTNQLQDLTL